MLPTQLVKSPPFVALFFFTTLLLSHASATTIGGAGTQGGAKNETRCPDCVCNCGTGYSALPAAGGGGYGTNNACAGGDATNCGGSCICAPDLGSGNFEFREAPCNNLSDNSTCIPDPDGTPQGGDPNAQYRCASECPQLPNGGDCSDVSCQAEVNIGGDTWVLPPNEVWIPCS